jgi:general secretion pathway protein D
MSRRIRNASRRAISLATALVFLIGILPAPAQRIPPTPGAPPPGAVIPMPTRPPTNPVQPEPYQAPNPEPASAAAAGGDSGHPLLSKDAADKLISVNFRDAPLDQVLTFYSELVGRTLLKSPGINATITLRGTTKLTVREALEAIESVLAMNNVALVPMGDKFLKVVQPTAVRQEGLPICGVLPEKPLPETDQLISQIVPLRFIEITEAQNVIQGFLHGYGKIQPLERANSLLITETASNLQRILEILQLIDQPTEARVETRIYELKYAEAGKIASRLNELIQDSQAKEEKPVVAAAAQPAAPAPGPPGVIRAGRSARPAAEETTQKEVEAALAERGIVQGKVKIVADERTNILIVIARPANFAFFDKIVAILDRPVEPEVVVRVLPLEYAKAEEIASILNDFIGAAKAESKTSAAAAAKQGEGGETPARATALEEYIAQRAAAAERVRQAVGEEKAKIGQLSPNTKILADKRTNSLLLMGTKGDLAALEEVIDRLDTMLAQVLIEAVILEVSLSRNVEYGIDWLQRSMTAYNDRKAGPGGTLVRQPIFSFGGGQRLADTTFRDASTIDRNDPTLGIGGLTYYTTIFDLNIDMVLRMAASSSDAKILSTPVILTTDNTEAKIVIGEERPVVTSTSVSSAGQQTSSYQYRNIGINLTVTPRINPQRFVVMEVSQTADNVGGFETIDGNRVPVITKREMQAQIAVPSRSTIVLGGLVSTDRRNSRSKVPILGDIPIVGTLFRSDTRNNNRTELLVLLTPYVLMTPEEARQETIRLHRSTGLGEHTWYRGWSDSPLARPTAEQLKAQKRAQKDQARKLAKAEAEKERSEKAQRDPSMPRISVVVPSEIPLDDIREMSNENGTDTSYEPPSVEVQHIPKGTETPWTITDEPPMKEMPQDGESGGASENAPENLAPADDTSQITSPPARSDTPKYDPNAPVPLR